MDAVLLGRARTDNCCCQLSRRIRSNSSCLDIGIPQGCLRRPLGRPGRLAQGQRRHGPRDELPVRIAATPDADPAVTIEQVTDALASPTPPPSATSRRLRGARIADRLQAEPGPTADQAATALGYAPAVHRAALDMVGVELRARTVQPYLQGVADALAAQGLAPVQVVEVRRLGEEHLAAAVQLEAGGEVPAPVWDERYGWRTAVSRCHHLRWGWSASVAQPHAASGAFGKGPSEAESLARPG